jgi:hypothetical protein
MSPECDHEKSMTNEDNTQRAADELTAYDGPSNVSVPHWSYG